MIHCIVCQTKSQWYQTSVNKKHINYSSDLEGHLRDLFDTISNIDCCLYPVIRPSFAVYTSQLIKVQQNELWKLKNKLLIQLTQSGDGKEKGEEVESQGFISPYLW